MKSFLTYLTLSILFFTGTKLVTAQKKYTGSIPKPPLVESDADTRFFVGRFASSGSSDKIPPFQMRLQLTDSYIKGSYRPANSKTDVDLVGAVNSQNELILIESTDGKPTGAFKGKLENGKNSLLKLSGVWTSVDHGSMHLFSVNEVQ